MARYPGARWRPIPETNSQARIKPTQVILHSAVSNASSLYGYWTSGGVTLESHFYVDRDGNVEQYVDTTVRADANYKANARAISIETWDGGNPDKNPWNAAQVKALVALVSWCCKTHDIPVRRTPAWDQPGIGGHSDYPGVWTPVRGKTCPGVARRPQVPQIIAAARGGTTTTATQPRGDEFDMADLKDLRSIVKDELATVLREISYLPDRTTAHVHQKQYNETIDHRGDGKLYPRLTWELWREAHKYALINNRLLMQLVNRDIGAAVVAALPKGSADAAVVQAAVEAGIRNILGSLNDDDQEK